jgi:iron complex outermembrane receptor protein
MQIPHTRTLRPMALALQLLFTGACVTGVILPLVASAQTTAAIHQFNIPAGSLSTALNQAGETAKVLLSFDPALVANQSSSGLQGSYSIEEALYKLLQGTGLVAQARGNGAYRLEKQNDSSLALVTVKAGRGEETATGPVNGYVAKRSATGTKTDTPIIETPQSISVISAEQIAVLQPGNLSDALLYTAGVNKAAYVDRVADQFVVRGFGKVSPYQDGMRYQVGIYDGQIEPYGLERLEVLKGAASTLYGTLPPGGMINVVTKQPTVDPLHEIKLEAGNFDRKQIAADFGGALTQDGDWSYRLTALHRDSGTSMDYGKDNRTFVAGAVRWQPTAVTSLTLRAEYQHDDTVYTPGLPLYGTLLTSPYGQLPKSLFIGEPGFDLFKVNRKVVGYTFEHAFNDALTLRHSLRYYQGNIHRRETMARNYYGATPNQTVFTRKGHERFQTSTGTTLDTSLQYKAQTGPIKHTAIVGVDYSHTSWRDEYYGYTMADLDLFNPVYGGAIGPQQLQSDDWTEQKISQLGVYVQDQMKIGDHWVVTAGGRQDYVTVDRRSPYTGAIEIDHEKSQKFSGRLGAVYLADNGIAPFAGFSQSFEPVAGADRLGNRFKPTVGEQFEVGVRYQPKGSDTLISAAVFQLTQNNVTVTDPLDTSFNTQLGRVRSRGFEVEARTRIGRNTNLIAAYSYTDARTIESSPLTPAENGKRSSFTPYNQMALWMDYDFGAFGLAGLRLGAGVRYTGETREEGSDRMIPSHTQFDAMASYTTGPWKFAVNVKNLTDKRYYTACSYRTCFLGEPLTVTTSAAYSW